jgi:outer membrane protein assembly factor BamB/tetratricopeptide (TPR) repeat protein
MAAFSVFFCLGMGSAHCAEVPAAEVPDEVTTLEEDDEEFDPAVYLDTDDEANRLLLMARRAMQLSSPNWRAAIDRYLELVSSYGSKLYPVNPRIYVSFRKLVRMELAAMPEEGREVYKILKGGEAQAALERALAAGSITELKNIPDNYPFLEAAPRALYLLGEWFKAGGRPAQAVNTWQKLLREYPEWSGASKSGLLMRAGLAALEAGHAEDAMSLLSQLREVAGVTPLFIGGEKSVAADELAARIKTFVADRSEEYLDSWPSVGGNAAHNGCVNTEVGTGVLRWQWTQFKKKPVVKNSRSPYGYYNPQTGAGGNLIIPLAQHGRIFLSGGDQLVALKSESGTLAWKASLHEKVSSNFTATSMNMPAIGDGKVFAVLAKPLSYQRFRPSRNSQNTKDPAGAVLRAYSVRSGKFQWQAGSEDSKSIKKDLESLRLLPVPVYSKGRIYCPAVKMGTTNDLFLMCFDARNGRLLWKAFAAAGSGLRSGPYYRSNRVTEFVLPPAVGDGLAVLITNMGAVVAIDAHSGEVKWAYIHDRVDLIVAKNTGGIFGRARSSRKPVLPSLWAPSPAVLVDGAVLVAPQDSPDLLALDLVSGQLRWKSHRGKLKHLVGVSQGKVLCSGGEEAVIFAAGSGKRLKRIKLHGKDTGLGLMGQSFAFVPTSAGVERLDLVAGKVTEVLGLKSGKSGSGNLVINQRTGILISTTNESTSGYYDWDMILARIGKRIKAQPENPLHRFDLAGVYRSVNRLNEAADFYKEVLSRCKGPANGELVQDSKRNIFECYTALASSSLKKSDFKASLKEAAKGLSYAVNTVERSEVHLLFARAREGLGENAKAVDQLRIIITANPDSYVALGSAKVRLRVFAQQQIKRLIGRHGREIYAPYDAQALSIYQKALADSNVKPLRPLVDSYPSSAVVSRALLLAGQLYTEASRHREASLVLREHCRRFPESPRALEVRARLLVNFKARGLRSLLKGMSRRLVSKWPQGQFVIAGRKWSVPEFIKQIRPEVLLPSTQNRLKLIAGMRKVWEGKGGSPMVIRRSPGVDEQITYIMFRRTGEIRAINFNSGKPQVLWKKANQFVAGNSRTVSSAVLATDGLVLLAGKLGNLLALAGDSGQVLWENKVFAKGNHSNVSVFARAGVVVVAGNAVIRSGRQVVTQKAVLLAIDEFTGVTLWRRNGKKINSSVTAMACSDQVVGMIEYERISRRHRFSLRDITSGKLKTSILLARGRSIQKLLIRGDRALLFGNFNRVDIYDINTGKLINSCSLSSRFNAILAADEKHVYVLCYQILNRKYRLSIVEVNLLTGKAKRISDPVRGQPAWNRSTLVRYGGRKHEVQNDTSQLVFFYKETVRGRGIMADVQDARTGKLVQRLSLKDLTNIYSVVSGKERLLVSGRTRRGYKRMLFDTRTGKLLERVVCSYGAFLKSGNNLFEVTHSAVSKLEAPVDAEKVETGKSEREK